MKQRRDGNHNLRTSAIEGEGRSTEECIWLELQEAMHREEMQDERLQEAAQPSEPLCRDQFLDTVRTMERYQVAGPSEQQTQALLASLMPMMEKEKPASLDSRSLLLKAEPDAFWLRVAHTLGSQVQLFSRMFWIVSALMIGIGAIFMFHLPFDDLNVFVFIISLVSALSVFYALRSHGTPMGRLEATFPVSPVEMAMGRLSIILLYNIAFGLLISIALARFGLTGPLLAFIVSWLVPVCLCIALALVAIIQFGLKLGAVLLIAVWGIQLMMRDILGPFYFMSDQGYEYWGVSRVIGAGLTIVLIILAIRTVRHRDHKGEDAHARTT